MAIKPGIKISKQTHDLFRRLFKILEPPPDLKLSEWADKYRFLSVEASPLPGRWHNDKTPYLREIMDAVTDINIQKIVIMSAAQVGKTEAILNAIGYYVHYEPSPILVVQPTITMGESFSKEKLSPTIRDTPVLAERISDKSRNSGNTIMQKVFPGGHVTIVGANSPSSLASRPIRIVLADEIDRYPATAGDEGDPLLLAIKRTENFWNKKIIEVSTPTTKEESRIAVEFENSSRGEWNIPCPCCGELQPLKWSGIVFDESDLSQIRYVCEKCGAVSSEFEWKERANEGKFIHQDPDNPIKGYHLNTLASLISANGWRGLVSDFIAANEEKKRGNVELLKVWTNTGLGETWEEEGETIDDDALYKRRERYNCEVPNDVMYLTAGVDTQDDRFEIEVVGWGADYESWGIKYAVIYGNNESINNKVWEDLDVFLDQTFTRADGAKMKIIVACIDSGGHRTNQVFKFCKQRFARRVFAIRGSNDSTAAYIQKPKKSNREGAYRFDLGVDTGKSLIMGRLQVEEEGPGYCHFPREEGRGYDRAYFTGLTSEKRTIKYKNGFPHFVWVKKDRGEHERNEPFDCRNYAQAAIEIAAVPLKKKAKKQTEKAKEPNKETKKAAGAQSTTRRRKRGRRNGGII